jgi:hypothetical protein
VVGKTKPKKSRKQMQRSDGSRACKSYIIPSKLMRKQWQIDARSLDESGSTRMLVSREMKVAAR